MFFSFVLTRKDRQSINDQRRSRATKKFEKKKNKTIIFWQSIKPKVRVCQPLIKVYCENGNILTGILNILFEGSIALWITKLWFTCNTLFLIEFFEFDRWRALDRKKHPKIVENISEMNLNSKKFIFFFWDYVNFLVMIETCFFFFYPPLCIYLSLSIDWS